MNRCVWIGYCCVYVCWSFWHPVIYHKRSMNLKLGMQWSECGNRFGWKLKNCMAFKKWNSSGGSIRLRKSKPMQFELCDYFQDFQIYCFQENPIHSNAINFDYMIESWCLILRHELQVQLSNIYQCKLDSHSTSSVFILWKKGMINGKWSTLSMHSINPWMRTD